jgi:hypothetical protein
MGETFYIGRQRLEMMRLESRMRKSMAGIPAPNQVRLDRAYIGDRAQPIAAPSVGVRHG